MTQIRRGRAILFLAILGVAGACRDVPTTPLSGSGTAALSSSGPSRPDVAVTGIAVSPTTVTRGDPVVLSAWTLRNVGDAAAVRITGDIILARDTALTQAAVTLAGVPSTNALPPRQEVAMDGASITIPEGTVRGTWYLGVRVAIGSNKDEGSLDNNYMSVRLTVRDPYTYVCPAAGEDPYTVLKAGVAATPDEGTMVICDGTFRVDTAVIVNKPMTIRPEHAGATTLADNWLGGFQQQAQAVFMVRNAPGLVRVVDLTFAIRGRGVVGDSNFARLEVDSSRFVSRETVGIGVMTNRSPGAGVVEVTHSHFERLSIGFFAVADNEANMRRSTSTDMNGSTMTWSNSSGHGVVEDNQISCGGPGCIRILNAGATIARRNVLDGRGKVVNGAGAIAVNPVTPGPHTPIVVEDNTILSARLTGDSTLATGWTVATAVFVSDITPAVHVIRRNTITAPYRGFQLSGSADIRDNTVTGGFFAFQQGPNVPVTVARNDFVSLGRSFTAPFNSVGDFRCNWWGSTNGPANPPMTTKYFPWAMQPVAGNASSCDPDVTLQTVRACPNEPLGGNPWNFGNVVAAYNAVAVGGTVNICDGTHVVQQLVISKAVTLQAAGPGMPILDGNGSNFVLNRSGGNFASTVRGLKLRNAANHLILVGNNSGTFVVENNVFEPRQSFAYNPDRATYQEAYWSGIGVFQGVGTVTIRSNTFLGGDIGVHVNTSPSAAAVNLTVTNNQFTGQTNAGLFTGATNPLLLLRAEGNTFDQCGRNGCTKVYGTAGGRVEYVNNRMNVSASRHVHTPFIILNPGGTALITGNQIVGTGGAGVRTQDLSYAIDGWGVQVRGTAEVSANTITDAFGGFLASGATLTGTDNVVTRMAWVIGGGGGPTPNTVSLTRNDITDYNQFVQGSLFASLDLRCNWWGSSTGPTNTGATSSTVWTPYATEPIAGKPGVSCTP